MCHTVESHHVQHHGHSLPSVLALYLARADIKQACPARVGHGMRQQGLAAARCAIQEKCFRHRNPAPVKSLGCGFSLCPWTMCGCASHDKKAYIVQSMLLAACALYQAMDICVHAVRMQQLCRPRYHQRKQCHLRKHKRRTRGSCHLVLT